MAALTWYVIEIDNSNHTNMINAFDAIQKLNIGCIYTNSLRPTGSACYTLWACSVDPNLEIMIPLVLGSYATSIETSTSFESIVELLSLGDIQYLQGRSRGRTADVLEEMINDYLFIREQESKRRTLDVLV